MLSCRPPSVSLPLPQRGPPSPPAPLPPCGRGGIWFVNAVSLPAAGSPLLRSYPPLPLPLGESGRGLGEGEGLSRSVGAEGGWGGR